ncbi:hypothetical protein OAT16_06000 [Prolixibacteraceae bacterium]|nr:hypothetical protein [Prolixibacteraceae bacterium]
MNIDHRTKEKCLALIEQKLEGQIESIHKQISDLKDSLINDTKSSAGDKYETGRERVAKDLGRLELQYEQYRKKLTLLTNLTVKSDDHVDFGSLVKTDHGIYFFSLALGKMPIDDTFFYALSVTSPIGQAMFGTKRGETILFQGRDITIIELL